MIKKNSAKINLKKNEIFKILMIKYKKIQLILFNNFKKMKYYHLIQDSKQEKIHRAKKRK